MAQRERKYSVIHRVNLGLGEDSRNFFHGVLPTLMTNRVNVCVLAVLDLPRGPQLRRVHVAWGAAYLG